jgi:MFS family permease
MCHVFAIHAVVTHIMPYLSSIGISRSIGSLAAGAIPVMSVAGRLSFGWLGDRHDKRYLMAVGVFLTAISFFGFALIGRYAALLLAPCIVLLSIGYGSPVPMIPAILRGYFGRKHLGAIIGYSQGLGKVGSLTGQPLAGFVFDTYGSYQAAWMIFAVVNLLGVLSIMSAPKIDERLRSSGET